jgi:hypothetical protein
MDWYALHNDLHKASEPKINAATSIIDVFKTIEKQGSLVSTRGGSNRGFDSSSAFEPTYQPNQSAFRKDPCETPMATCPRRV